LVWWWPVWWCSRLWLRLQLRVRALPSPVWLLQALLAQALALLKNAPPTAKRCPLYRSKMRRIAANVAKVPEWVSKE